MEGTATVTSGSTTTGPASFSDPGLTWSEAPSASTPTSDSTPAASASAETTPPSADGSTPSATPAAGEPPKERWDAILANARAKAAEEALAPYAWAKQVQPQEFQQISAIARHFASGNVVEGITSLLAEARKDPAVDAQLKSLHARALSAARGQTAAAQPDLNPIQVQLENGQTVGLYSAEQIGALKSQWLAEAEQKFQPVVETVGQVKAEREAIAKQQQIEHFASTTFADVKTWPGMEDAANQKAVAEALSRATVDPNDPREVALALNAAYRQVVLPTLNRKAEATLLDSLKTKAAASSSVNPGSAASSTPKAYASFYDLPKSAWK